ncbi:MAG: DUF916 domain-containing protein [Chloroflexi bacterium]|nr:MAG: DUF916 domain-containing protein [Chloroflexota bacterium]MBL1193627.1 DUF916 domain-containing protein [Chloroflexota bacterium]NOH10919.1 DUF916 domain-containing protein [Chloroflexota bacterium]
MKKLFQVFIILSLVSLIIPRPVFAQADVGISFGIRPTKAFEDRPETFSYFHHILTPGQVLQDEALVMNGSEQPITLKLYTGDGISAQNGGTTFRKQGEHINGVSGWLSPSEMEIKLGAGEEANVPFSITVPADTPPGHHVAGLVVEALPTEG